jgi:hypothetical protein
MDYPFRRMLLDVTVWTLTLGVTMLLVIHEVRADSRSYTTTHPTWQAECGGCHFAYPPQLLPAPAWRRIMSELTRHFGSDASVDSATAAEIGAFLEQHAGNDRRARSSQTLRITEATWFKREHDEMSASVWKRSAVKTPANCTACHSTAERGDFRKRNINIPR